MHVSCQCCYTYALPVIQSEDTASHAIASSGVLDCDWRIAVASVDVF
jgi:hypothetical protein